MILGILALVIGTIVISTDLSPAFAASRTQSLTCIEPYPGLVMTEDTTLCPGVYEWPYDIIPGIKLAGDGITLDCNQAVLQGDTIRYHPKRGIDVQGNGNTVKNCIVRNFNHCIHLDNLDHTIQNNEVWECGEYGIHLASGSGHMIMNNNIINREHEGWKGIGLYPDGEGLSTVRNNLVDFKGYFGIYEHGQPQNTMVIRENTVLRSLFGISITEGSDGVTVLGNTIRDSRLGIKLTDGARNNVIKDNTISGSEVGIFAQHDSENNNIEGNEITTTTNPIVIDPSADAIVSDNTIV